MQLQLPELVTHLVGDL